MNFCYSNQLISIIVEGGKKTIQEFIDANLWDEARIFVTNKKLNNGTSAPKLKASIKFSENLGKDLLNFYFK